MKRKLVLGGLGAGGLSILVRHVWGNGYSSVDALLHIQWTWTAVLMVLTFKILATALTTGSGTVSGVFTPTLFVGAALGPLSGAIAHGMWPGGTSDSAVYVVVGMGAFLAASTHAPLTAILMIFEMTMSYHAMLPLMLACVVAYVVAHSLCDLSAYEATVRRHRDAASPA